MQLSPEKLAEIKRDIVNAVEEEKASSAHNGLSSVTKDAPGAVVEDDKPPAMINDELEVDTGADMDVEIDEQADPIQKATDAVDDCIGLFDSPDFTEAPKVRKQAAGKVGPDPITPQIDIPLLPHVECTVSATKASKLNLKRKSEETKKVFKKECINPGCAGSSEEFLESPLFAMTFYYVSQKANKIQYICSQCHHLAIIKFEVNFVRFIPKVYC